MSPVTPATIRTDVEGEEKNPVRRIVSPSVNHRIIDSWILIARSRSITIIYRTVTIFPSPSFDHRIFPTLGLLLLLHISCFFESNRSVLVQYSLRKETLVETIFTILRPSHPPFRYSQIPQTAWKLLHWPARRSNQSTPSYVTYACTYNTWARYRWCATTAWGRGRRGDRVGGSRPIVVVVAAE